MYFFVFIPRFFVFLLYLTEHVCVIVLFCFSFELCALVCLHYKRNRDVHLVSVAVCLLCFVISFCPIYGSSVFPA